MLRAAPWLLLLVASAAAPAQWQIETSNTTADLRGIDSVGNGVAWASGTNGTVLRTEDSGYVWQKCAVPPGAEHLDFRAIRAFNANMAIAMSSGKGDQSRLYKTTDGCSSWKLLLTNADAEGFWDALVLNRTNRDGQILGDPVHEKFVLLETNDRGENWEPSKSGGLDALAGEGAFAASNSSLFLNEEFANVFVTGGPAGARVFVNDQGEGKPFKGHALPLASGEASTGAYAIEARDARNWVVVGGDYTKPEETAGTAVWTRDGGKTWLPSKPMPHGYRSSVAYERPSGIWIAVGPNGTDISRDNGHSWEPLRPNAKNHEEPDADRSWNAISLPFVVGPKGRIGRLNENSLPR
ncbi:hypothetical protein DYQ86_05385 [Acidobacteria bacterium AB60]|nr:hypothetical protein DYQ86_05385 [Acidobacteria bacterium AB60]